MRKMEDLKVIWCKKARKQGSNNKRKCNSPIFSTFVCYYVIHVLNIGLFHFPLMLYPCFLAFYTTIAFKSYIPPPFSLRMILVTYSLYSINYSIHCASVGLYKRIMTFPYSLYSSGGMQYFSYVKSSTINFNR